MFRTTIHICDPYLIVCALGSTLGSYAYQSVVLTDASGISVVSNCGQQLKGTQTFVVALRTWFSFYPGTRFIINFSLNMMEIDMMETSFSCHSMPSHQSFADFCTLLEHSYHVMCKILRWTLLIYEWQQNGTSSNLNRRWHLYFVVGSCLLLHVYILWPSIMNPMPISDSLKCGMFITFRRVYTKLSPNPRFD